MFTALVHTASNTWNQDKLTARSAVIKHFREHWLEYAKNIKDLAALQAPKGDTAQQAA